MPIIVVQCTGICSYWLLNDSAEWSRPVPVKPYLHDWQERRKDNSPGWFRSNWSPYFRTLFPWTFPWVEIGATPRLKGPCHPYPFWEIITFLKAVVSGIHQALFWVFWVYKPLICKLVRPSFQAFALPHFCIINFQKMSHDSFFFFFSLSTP